MVVTPHQSGFIYLIYLFGFHRCSVISGLNFVRSSRFQRSWTSMILWLWILKKRHSTGLTIPRAYICRGNFGTGQTSQVTYSLGEFTLSFFECNFYINRNFSSSPSRNSFFSCVNCAQDSGLPITTNSVWCRLHRGRSSIVTSAKWRLTVCTTFRMRWINVGSKMGLRGLSDRLPTKVLIWFSRNVFCTIRQYCSLKKTSNIFLVKKLAFQRIFSKKNSLDILKF